MTKTCTGCKETKSIDMYSNNNSMPDGKQIYCRECWNKMARDRKRIETKKKKRPKQQHAFLPSMTRELIYQRDQDKCVLCNYDNPRALVIHHKDRNRENNHISNLIILCANCHQLIHR